MSAPIPLAKAIEDPRLLGGRVEWRPKQRELLASLDGPETLHVWCLGRQSGKSSMAAVAGLWNAALRPDLDEVMPAGEWRTILVVSPSEEQSRALKGKVAAAVESSPMIAPHAEVWGDRVDFTIPRVDASGRKFTARSRVLALPANSKSIRGFTSSMVIAEEAAHFDDSGGPGSDQRIFEAVGPTLARFGDLSCLLIISSAYGESGLFFDLLSQVQAGEIPNARAAVHTTQEMWPEVSQAFLEGERRRLGADAFAREYECVASSGAGSFFDLSGLDFADGPAPPEAGRDWVCGMDPAWSRDQFGYALLGESVEVPGLLVTGAVGAVEPGERLRSFVQRRRREDATLEQVWRAIEPYTPRVVTDQASGDQVREYFQREGAPTKVVHLTGPLQAAAFTALRARLDDGSLSLWRCAELLDELRRVSTKGPDKIHLKRAGSSHGDIASALALAAHELRGVTGEETDARPRGGRVTLAPGSDLSRVAGSVRELRLPREVLAEARDRPRWARQPRSRPQF